MTIKNENGSSPGLKLYVMIFSAFVVALTFVLFIATRYAENESSLMKKGYSSSAAIDKVCKEYGCGSAEAQDQFLQELSKPSPKQG